MSDPAKMHPQHAVGTRQPLVDGVEKVTGRARYTADLARDDALVGMILRSPVAHGIIRSWLVGTPSSPANAHGRKLWKFEFDQTVIVPL